MIPRPSRYDTITSRRGRRYGGASPRHGVCEPAHAQASQAREPGDPMGFHWARRRHRTVERSENVTDDSSSQRLLRTCFEMYVRWPSEAVECKNSFVLDGLGGPSYGVESISNHVLAHTDGPRLGITNCTRFGVAPAHCLPDSTACFGRLTSATLMTLHLSEDRTNPSFSG